MNLSDSNYFNALPYAIQENVRQSGMVFENDEEVNMFVANTKELSAKHSFFNHPLTYPHWTGWFWPS